MKKNYLNSIIKLNIYKVFYSTILYRFGFGYRVGKAVWDKEYENNEWEYLASEDEKEHYKATINQVNSYGGAPVILDIGCGHGVLYKYFTKLLKPGFGYLGIDISDVAIEKATVNHPEAAFKVVDYDFEKVEGEFNIIVFNEVLNYFVKPIKTLLKACNDNLSEGGVIIISMYQHDNGKVNLIWKDIDKNFKVLNSEVVTNDKGLSWTIKTITL